MESDTVLSDMFGRVQEVVHVVVKDLRKDQLAFRPDGTANSISWLIWHLTRIQDDHVAGLAGQEQIWTQNSWAQKFDLPFDNSATGWGHNSEAVSAVQVTAKQLIGYFDAVHEQTITYINSLTEKDYAKVIDETWDTPVTVAVRLVSIISDDLQHAGQAAYILGLLQ